MTAPPHSAPVDVPVDPPYARVASVVVVVAAFLVGAGALAVSSVLSADLVRLLIALVLVGAGWGIARPAREPGHALTLAIGGHVLRGVGTSYVVLGAYLGGLALLTASLPDGPFDQGPSPALVILLGHGVPALALLALATTGMRAWTAGAGAVLPMIAVLLMASAGASTAIVSISMLVVGVVLAVVVVRAPVDAAWGNLAAAAAAMATSFAFGAGTSPFGTLSTTQLAGASETGPAGTLSGAALVAVLAGSLLVAAVLLLVAVARHDLAGGVLTASIFAMPPVLLSTWLPADARWPAEAVISLAAVPVLVALTAMLAIRVPTVRDALTAALPLPAREPRVPVGADEPGDTHADGVHDADDPAAPGSASEGDPAPAHQDADQPAVDSVRRPSAAIATAACAVVVAAAVVGFVVLALPVLGWDPRVQGGVALVVLAGVGALGYWLPATPGAAGAVVALLGLGLASPWARLLGNWAGASDAERAVTGALDLVAAAALAWFLTRRHSHPGVFAAAAYTLAGSAAAFLGSLLFDASYVETGALPFGSETGPVVIVALPLVLLGLAAAAAMIRGHLAVGQAVGAVVLAAAGFVPLKVLVGQFAGGGVGSYALQIALDPLTPTDWLQTSAAFRDVAGSGLVALLVMALLALGLATSLATRPSAPLAAAVALLFLAAVQASLLSVLSSGSSEDAQLLGQVLGGLAALTAVIAIAAAVTAARRTRRPE